MELLCPRTDGPRVMKQLYDALKNKPCDCQWSWKNGKYGPDVECKGHQAMAAYEILMMVTA